MVIDDEVEGEDDELPGDEVFDDDEVEGDDDELPGDEVVDDDEVEGEERAAADVNDLQAREGEQGQLVNLHPTKIRLLQCTAVQCSAVQ